jgi:ketopantoate hydroxymethyltransferase
MEKAPKFVKNFMQDNVSIHEAIEDYVRSVKDKDFPSSDHSFE